MNELSMADCEEIQGGNTGAVASIAKAIFEAAKALSESDSGRGQDGGQISDTPAA